MAILDKTQLENLARDVDEAVRFGMLGEASTLSAQIKNTLKAGGLNEELEKVLKHYLVELSFVRFLAISESEFLSLLSHNISDSYGIPDFDLIQKFGDRFSLITFPDEQVEFLQKVISALESNDEVMGKKPLVINSTEVKPTMGNWIALYKLFPAKKAQRSQLDVVEFLSKNGEGLSEVEKLVLNESLKLYNGSRNWVINYNNLPEAGENDDIPEELIMDMLYGSEDEEAKPSVVPSRTVSVDGLKAQQPRSVQQQVQQSQRPQPARPPQQIAPQPKPQPQPVVPVPQAPSSQTEEPPTTDEIVENIKRQEANPETVSRLQELLHKAPQTTPSPTPEKQSVPDPQISIDAKLSELKKRINPNE